MSSNIIIIIIVVLWCLPTRAAIRALAAAAIALRECVCACAAYIVHNSICVCVCLRTRDKKNRGLPTGTERGRTRGLAAGSRGGAASVYALANRIGEKQAQKYGGHRTPTTTPSIRPCSPAYATIYDVHTSLYEAVGRRAVVVVVVSVLGRKTSAIILTRERCSGKNKNLMPPTSAAVVAAAASAHLQGTRGTWGGFSCGKREPPGRRPRKNTRHMPPPRHGCLLVLVRTHIIIQHYTTLANDDDRHRY